MTLPCPCRGPLTFSGHDNLRSSLPSASSASTFYTSSDRGRGYQGGPTISQGVRFGFLTSVRESMLQLPFCGSDLGTTCKKANQRRERLPVRYACPSRSTEADSERVHEGFTCCGRDLTEGPSSLQGPRPGSETCRDSSDPGAREVWPQEAHWDPCQTQRAGKKGSPTSGGPMI